MGSAHIDNIIIDTRPTPVKLSIDLSYFNPNGTRNAVTFGLNVPVATGIEKWSVAVQDGQGQARRTFSGTVSIPRSIVWDGKDNAGSGASRRQLQGQLSVLYVNGHAPDGGLAAVTIKLTAPTAAAKAEFDVFSPIGDSPQNTVAIYQDTSSELFWTGTFKDDEQQGREDPGVARPGG